MKKKIFLVIPYSWNPNRSFHFSIKVAAKLRSEGYAVYNPIAIGHTMAKYLPSHLQKDNDFWWEQNEPFLRLCNEVRVVMIGKERDGLKMLDASDGSQRELTLAKKLKKPVRYEYSHAQFQGYMDKEIS